MTCEKLLSEIKDCNVWPITYLCYLSNIFRPELSTYVNTLQVTMYPEFQTDLQTIAYKYKNHSVIEIYNHGLY